MRQLTILVATIVLGGWALSAQDDLAQYQTWMKSAAGANNAVRAAVTAKDSAAIADNSKKMAEAFDSIAKFWAAKHKDDAVKFAETARDNATKLGAAASDADQQAALTAIAGACRGCHPIYRNGSTFKQ
jgi:hypothetical protein